MDEVCAVEVLVDLLYSGELLLVAFGEPLGVHPQRVAGAFELCGQPGLAGFASVVPDLAADLVERVGAELDDVERIEAYLGGIDLAGFGSALMGWRR